MPLGELVIAHSSRRVSIDGPLRCGTREAGFGEIASAHPSETVNCTDVTAVPAVISTRGIYCLTQSLTAAGGSGTAAITISADDIVLDLNGWTLTSTCDQQFCPLSGIARQGHRVTVRNAAIRGFSTGIQQSSGSPQAAARNVLEGLRISQCVLGIFISTGGGDIIRDNFVHTITGTAIWVEPHSVRLVNNDVEDVRGDEGAGVLISGGSPSTTESPMSMDQARGPPVFSATAAERSGTTSCPTSQGRGRRRATAPTATTSATITESAEAGAAPGLRRRTRTGMRSLTTSCHPNPVGLGHPPTGAPSASTKALTK